MQFCSQSRIESQFCLQRQESQIKKDQRAICVQTPSFALWDYIGFGSQVEVWAARRLATVPPGHNSRDAAIRRDRVQPVSAWHVPFGLLQTGSTPSEPPCVTPCCLLFTRPQWSEWMQQEHCEGQLSWCSCLLCMWREWGITAPHLEASASLAVLTPLGEKLCFI